LGDHRDAHDDVAEDEHGVVAVGEERFDAGGQDEDAAHLDEGEDPVEPIVGREGGGEPGEVHPGPPDAEEHHGVGDEAVEDMGLGQGVVQVDGRDAHGNDEDQVKEELERCRGPARLVRVARPHRDQARTRQWCGGVRRHRVPSAGAGLTRVAGRNRLVGEQCPDRDHVACAGRRVRQPTGRTPC
jgi:hypothetical protein